MLDAHGVSYPPALLGSLPQLTPPVRLLSANAFEKLHLSHIVSHPQDHVLFPFLHGLEGENEAQNSFFATAPNAHETHMHTQTQRPRVKVPKYRGLVWVVCEEDLEAEGDAVSLRILRRKNLHTVPDVASPSSSMYSSSSDSFEDDDDDDDDDDYNIEDDYLQDGQQDIRVGVAGSDEGGMQLSHDEPMDIEQSKDKTLPEDPDNQIHMHPVNHRSIHHPSTIPVSSSVSSTNTSSSSGASFSFDTSTSSTSPESDLTSGSSYFPNYEATPDALTPGLDCRTERAQASPVPPKSRVTDPSAPPLFTGTFRPKELLRHVRLQNGEFDWEFSPVKVPEGISLRNFGIQVPIYATLSDIVVYSPKGVSPAAIALAQRFARAIELKRQERIRALGFSGLPDEEEVHSLLKYNVFVLDAAEEDMRRGLSHLMMRICVEPVTGGLFGTRTINHGAHTDGSDGHVVELDAVESRERETTGLGVVGDMEMDVDDPPQAVQKRPKGATDELIPNTVDFAQREKEEMRDLTKASEIISLFPLPPTASPKGSPSWGPQEEGTQQRHRSHSSATSPHHPYRSTRPPHLQFLPQVQPPTLSQPDFTFSPPLTADIDTSSTASHFDPRVGQVFLGNSGDVPLAQESPQSGSVEDDPFDYEGTNDPRKALGYDICIECHDLATFPSAAHLRAAEEHLAMMDLAWAQKYECHMQERFDRGEDLDEEDIPPRPPPHANAVIHLTLPSSPSNTQVTMSSLMPVLRFLEKWLRPVVPPPCNIVRPPLQAPSPAATQAPPPGGSSGRRWSSVTSFMPSFVPFTSSSSSNSTSTKSANSNNILPPRNRSFTSPSPAIIPSVLKPKPRSRPTRPLKVLIYSSDGYTESSVPALCLLMAIKGLSLPEAYLELQVAKRRSFFVYSNDLGILRRMENRLREERERSGLPLMNGVSPGSGTRGWANGSIRGAGNRPAAKSVSFGTPPNLPGFIRSPAVVAPLQPPGSHTTPQQTQLRQHAHENDVATIPDASGQDGDRMAASVGSLPTPLGHNSSGESVAVIKGRPRANTSPWLPSLFGGDHQLWFNDPRFDGSFPSRVLPFLYLGNLNHASNAYMLHALGITHVVSVGECALVPPPTTSTSSAGGTGHMTSNACNHPGPSAQFVAGKGPGMHGSLWIEEREGRIKVLDIKGVCDDGIDTLEPQLEPICEWIDKARQEGGQVLVHCRVGVSRSATVTIAYVMKHLNLPLVDAYLIVRSRRLSVLIQPNMRLLYNLCGWEIKLAKERADGDEKKLKRELSRTLSWPYLAKEVHALNQKYLH